MKIKGIFFIGLLFFSKAWAIKNDSLLKTRCLELTYFIDKNNVYDETPEFNDIHFAKLNLKSVILDYNQRLTNSFGINLKCGFTARGYYSNKEIHEYEYKGGASFSNVSGQTYTNSILIGIGPSFNLFKTDDFYCSFLTDLVYLIPLKTITENGVYGNAVKYKWESFNQLKIAYNIKSIELAFLVDYRFSLVPQKYRAISPNVIVSKMIPYSFGAGCGIGYRF